MHKDTKMEFSRGLTRLPKQERGIPAQINIVCGIALFIVLMLFSTGARAATYYMCGSASSCNSTPLPGVVAPGSGWSTGSSGNNGTSKSTPFDSLHTAFPKMAGGDTLIIGNGTYTGAANEVGDNDSGSAGFAPYGTSSAWTTVKADNTGGVLFDGQATRPMIYLYQSSGANLYTVFQGLVWANAQANYGPVSTNNVSYIRFLQCGAYNAGSGNTAVFDIGRSSSYILLEGCYAYGLSRYKFLIYTTTHVVVRNCVARQDAADLGGTTNPVAFFSLYDSSDLLVQNCIGVDGDGTDGTQYVNGTGQYGGCFPVFTTDNAVDTVTVTNSVCINSKIGGFLVANTNDATNITYSNDVFWGLQTQTPTGSGNGGRSPIIFNRAQSATVSNLTGGTASDTNSEANPYFAWDYGTQSLDNSIFTNITLYNSSTSVVGNLWGGGTLTQTYNDFYSDTGANPSPLETGEKTANPSIQWPVLSCTTGLPATWTGISGSTSMCGAGSGGANIGANLIYQQGASGTLYGATGYNLQQDGTNGQATVLMWPFPNEAVIQARMAAYTNSTYSVTGTRGFCAGYNTSTNSPATDSWGNPMTLTRYIWQYAGNQIPSSIYGGSSGSPPPPPPAPYIAPIQQ